MKTRLLTLFVFLLVLVALTWGALKTIQFTSVSAREEVPATRVRKGKVTITVAARGELQGGNSESLPTPMTGGGDLAITYLREPGELVDPGDVVVQFDTTQQEYNLREAQADLAEAEQQVVKADTDGEAALEEARYAVLSAQSDVRGAELEMRRSPLLAAIAAHENELALESARNRLHQAQQDFDNRKATATAGTAIQKAAENKARVMADMAQRTIDSMVLKAKTKGYVNIQQNSNQNLMYIGMQLPQFQTGDSARAGQIVAQIPDLHDWEVSASIPEVDRGHLNQGQKASVNVAALPGHQFHGHIKSLGGTTGPPWSRYFECRVALEDWSPELRPGMSANLVITVETLEDALSVPSQAVSESDGRAFVYLRTPQGFVPRDVALVRRSESQAVVSGIHEGDLVALSSPEQAGKKASRTGGAMKALGR